MIEKWGIWVKHIFWLMKHYHVNITGLPVFKENNDICWILETYWGKFYATLIIKYHVLSTDHM